MILVNVWSESNKVTVDFDCEEDFEVLKFQVCSITNDFQEFTLVDFAGREVSTSSDLSLLDHTTLVSDSSNEHQVDLWIVNRSMTSNCTCTHFGDRQLLQPRYRIVDTSLTLCAGCHGLFDSSLILNPASNPSASLLLEPFLCCHKSVVEMGLLSENVGDASGSSSVALPVQLYLQRKLLDDVCTLQSSALTAITVTSPAFSELQQQRQQFFKRLQSGVQTIGTYDLLEQQRVARKCIDYGKILAYMQEYSSAATEVVPPDVAFVKGLLKWFKRDFFTWCNKPTCCNCYVKPDPGATAANTAKPTGNVDRMNGIGTVMQALPEEAIGWPSRIEQYQCMDCGAISRFPRYNNPSHLCSVTRTGRCGEWSNAFGLVCKALALDVRYVLDFTDHVWCEIYIPSWGRYAHADPCEMALDTPLVYEAGWNKKLLYCISYSSSSVVDATARYTRKYADVVQRRNNSVVPECFGRQMISEVNAQQEAKFRTTSSFSMAPSSATTPPLQFETLLQNGASAFAAQCAQRQSNILEEAKRRDLDMIRELSGMTFLTGTTAKLEELKGRDSGDQAWKASRGELGGGAAASASSSSTNGSPPIWWSADLITASRMLSESPSHHRGGIEVFLEYDYKRLPRSDIVQRAASSYESVSCRNRNAIVDGNANSITDLCINGVELSTTVAASLFDLWKCKPSTAELLLRQGEVKDSVICASSAVRALVETWIDEKDGHINDAPRTGWKEIDGFECGAVGVCDTVELSSTESIETVIQQVKDKCMADPQLLGFAVHRNIATVATCASESKNSAVPSIGKVVCFGDRGYPLQKVSRSASGDGNSSASCTVTVPYTSTVYCKSLIQPTVTAANDTKVLAASEDASSCAPPPLLPVTPRCPPLMSALVYVPLGGAHHGDTVPFDNTRKGAASDNASHDHFLWEIVKAGSDVTLLGIDMWAENILQGVQTHYRCRPQSSSAVAVAVAPLQQVSSSLILTPNDNPTKASLILGEDEEVTAVEVRYGALVDSVTIVTNKGVTKRFGGTGGGEQNKCTIPTDHWKLVGFFGGRRTKPWRHSLCETMTLVIFTDTGMGGHFHNIGIVLMRKSVC